MLNLTKGLIGAAIVSLSAGLCLSAQAAEINSAEQKASNVQPLVLAKAKLRSIHRKRERETRKSNNRLPIQNKQGGRQY